METDEILLKTPPDPDDSDDGDRDISIERAYRLVGDDLEDRVIDLGWICI